MNEQINVIFIAPSVWITWLKFIHVLAEVTLMAVQFINVESFTFLRKFIRPKNPVMSASITNFVFFLHRSEKNMAAKFKRRVEK